MPWSKITLKIKSLFGLNGFRGRVCNGEVWQAARAGSWGITSSTINTRQGRWTASEAMLYSQSQPPGIYFLLQGPRFQRLLNFPPTVLPPGTGYSNAWAKGGHLHHKSLKVWPCFPMLAVHAKRMCEWAGLGPFSIHPAVQIYVLSGKN